jgi:hypothetical protein
VPLWLHAALHPSVDFMHHSVIGTVITDHRMHGGMMAALRRFMMPQQHAQ